MRQLLFRKEVQAMETREELMQQNDIVLKASALIVEVNVNNGNVSRLFIQSMESYKLPLLRIVAKDGSLKHYAMRTLNSLNAAIDFARGDRSARKRMIAEYKASDRIADRLRMELKRKWQ